MRLYHRTSPADAAVIVRTRTWRSKEQPPYVYFSTKTDGQASAYGSAVVAVDVPESAPWMHLDDEFPSGEQHYAILTRDLAGRPVELVGGSVKQNPAPPTKIQSLIFDRDRFTPAAARAWAKNHGFDQLDVDEKTNTLRLRQRRPANFEAGSFRTIPLTEGVQAVIGRAAVGVRANPAPHLVVWVPGSEGFVDEHGATRGLDGALVTHSREQAAATAAEHGGVVLEYDAAEAGERPEAPAKENPSRFKWQVGQSVVYVVAPGADAAVPATWRGRIVSREPNIEDGLYYSVRWTTPSGETHEGLYHESDLAQLGARSTSRENPIAATRPPTHETVTLDHKLIRFNMQELAEAEPEAFVHVFPRSPEERHIIGEAMRAEDIRRAIAMNDFGVREIAPATENPADVEELPGAVEVGDAEIRLIKRNVAARGAGLLGGAGNTGAPDDILVEVSTPGWTQLGEVDPDGTVRWPAIKKITPAMKKAVIGLLVGPPWSTHNTSAERAQERDNLSVRLVDARGKAIVDVSDDEARELFADGFLRADNLHVSLVEYANTLRLKAG